MHEGQASKRVLPVANLREFFKDALHGALEKRQLCGEDQTEHYVVNLLTLFSRSEALYDTTPEGTRLKPLVVMLSEALEARSQAIATAACNVWVMSRSSLRDSSHRALRAS